jgi:hypothetical protein
VDMGVQIISQVVSTARRDKECCTVGLGNIYVRRVGDKAVGRSGGGVAGF